MSADHKFESYQARRFAPKPSTIVAEPLPSDAQRAGAGVGLRVRRELAVEFSEQRHAVRELELGAGGGSARIGWSRSLSPPRARRSWRAIRR
jgi:hypothetical protein